MEEKYNPHPIELKWQKKWEENRIFKTRTEKDKPKFYELEMYPYPSGKIHMGHVRNYSIGDVIARYRRMNGYNVMHPIGFDAFGMPAENAAIEHNLRPETWTKENIATMTKQLKRMGFSYDWDGVVTTCDSEYYRWEQKLFIEMLRKDMVYKKKAEVNYCPHCQTVLANEQVMDGKCWRCGGGVTKKEIGEWFFRITDYAEQLLRDMEQIRKGWPEKVLIQQKNWIGKSIGARVKFKVSEKDEVLEVFTTRPDTLFGATFMCIAPDHPLLKKLVKGSSYEEKVQKFIEKFLKTKDIKEKEKEGIFTGIYAENPVNGEKIPLYAANFVLLEYGTGIIMSVPAHDQRDFEFAKKYNLPLKVVTYKEDAIPKDGKLTEAYEGEGTMVNSGQFDKLPSEQGKWEVTKWLQQKGLAEKTINYALRDWNVSRQRYWGAPIPVVYCKKCGIVPVNEEDLPIELPENTPLTGEGDSPLKRVKSFVKTTCPQCGGEAERETDTFDTFVESSWYFLRYVSPHEKDKAFDERKAQYWMPVDQYVGGIEHAVMHLLYARYFTKVFRDLKYIDIDEPFKRLLTQGMVIKDGAKMSKSKGNVVDPDYIIENYGADTSRLFILFAAPPEKDLDWSDEGVEGSYRFLNRVWRIVYRYKDVCKSSEKVVELKEEKNKRLHYLTHFTIKWVTEDIEKRYHFNTAIAHLMEFTNAIYDYMYEEKEEDKITIREAIRTLIMLLSVFAPHIAEEMWEGIGEKPFVSDQCWPKYDEKALIKKTIKMAITVNGRLRDEIEVEKDAAEEKIRELALNSKRIQKYIQGKEVKKIIVVKQKLVNMVVK
ncbi:MAG: leucine--tRNA ligase [Deltaproteobacteria bacterium]|nr:leucine--tRNA ligase [Deltaproteobacteria bacterium]